MDENKLSLLSHTPLKYTCRQKVSISLQHSMGKIVFNEDEEIVVPEPVAKKPEQIEEQISDDDEAPEAISTSTAKQASLFKANLEKEAAAK